MSRCPHPAPSLGAWPFWLRLAFARDGAADEFPEGEVAGLLAATGVKQGENGAVTIQRRVRYDTRTVGGVTIHPRREDIAFPVA